MLLSFFSSHHATGVLPFVDGCEIPADTEPDAAGHQWEHLCTGDLFLHLQQSSLPPCSGICTVFTCFVGHFYRCVVWLAFYMTDSSCVRPAILRGSDLWCLLEND